MLPGVLPKWPFVKLWDYKSGIYDSGYSYHVAYLQSKDHILFHSHTIAPKQLINYDQISGTQLSQNQKMKHLFTLPTMQTS